MKKIPKQEYTAEFKELAVKRVKDGLTPGFAAKELGVSSNPAQLAQGGSGRQA
jgi:transposase